MGSTENSGRESPGMTTSERCSFICPFKKQKLFLDPVVEFNCNVLCREVQDLSVPSGRGSSILRPGITVHAFVFKLFI